MTVLRPTSPESSFHRKLDRTLLLTFIVGGSLFGAWEAKSCSEILSGYAAGYDLAIAWQLAILACFLGSLLLIHWRTRWFGGGLIVAGLLSITMFYASMLFLLKTDRVAWKHEPPPVEIGPDQKASVIVYFKHGVTDDQIEAFNTDVLQEHAEPRHAGKDFPDFFSEYLRLLPDQTNGFEAVALTFRRDAPQQRTKEYIDKIKADPRVEKIVLDAVPREVTRQRQK